MSALNTTDDFEHHPNTVSDTAHGITHQDIRLRSKESVNGASSSGPIALQQNDAYTLEEPVVTDADDSYDYPAKFDPSNSIEAKRNEAYAIITEKNEAYKPVVSVSEECDEYEYII